MTPKTRPSTSEAAIEAWLVKRVNQQGCECEKQEGTRGACDRIVTGPGRLVYYVETKRPGEEPSPQQLLYHRRKQRMGFDVFVIDSYEGVEEFIRRIKFDKSKQDLADVQAAI